MSITREEQRTGDRDKSLKDWIYSSSAPSTCELDDVQLLGSSIAEDLCSAVMDYFQTFWHGIRGSDIVAKGGLRNKIKKSLESFILWHHDFRDGRLNRVLDHSETLKIEVLTVFYGMAKLLLGASKRFRVSTPNDSSEQALGELLAKTADIIAEEDIEGEISTGEDSEGGSSSDSRHHYSTNPVEGREQKWLTQFYKDMCCHTESLTDLAFSLDQTLDFVDKLTREDKTPRTTSFTVSDPAQVYVSNVLDKFPNADSELVKRLGQKNWERHKSIRMRAEEKENRPIIHGEETAPSLFKPFSLFHDSGLGLSTTTITAYATSVISHSSFVSSVADRERRSWRVPPLPLAATAGKPFRCDLCGQVQDKIKNRIDWKIHVFSDLQPYICTFPGCNSELVTFPRRALWAEHEFNMHRMKKTWACSNCPLEYGSIEEWTEHLHSAHGTEFSGPLAKVALEAAERQNECLIKDQSCPFCLKTPATTRKDFVRHVGRHLEEVALAALPIDDTSDFSDSDHSKINEGDSSLNFGKADLVPLPLSDDQLPRFENALHEGVATNKLSPPPMGVFNSSTDRNKGPSQKSRPLKWDWAPHIPRMVELYHSGLPIPQIYRAIQQDGFRPSQRAVYDKFKSEGYSTNHDRSSMRSQHATSPAEINK